MPGTDDDPFRAPPPGAPAAPLPAASPYVPAYGEPLAGRRNGFGVAALVLGIVALPGVVTIVLGVVLGVLAIIFGVLGRGRVRRGEADNGGAALTGIILGAVAVVLSGIFVAVFVGLFTSGTGRSVRHCLERAHGDPVAVRHCQDDLRSRLTGAPGSR